MTLDEFLVAFQQGTVKPGQVIKVTKEELQQFTRAAPIAPVQQWQRVAPIARYQRWDDLNESDEMKEPDGSRPPQST